MEVLRLGFCWVEAFWSRFFFLFFFFSVCEGEVLGVH